MCSSGFSRRRNGYSYRCWNGYSARLYSNRVVNKKPSPSRLLNTHLIMDTDFYVCVMAITTSFDALKYFFVGKWKNHYEFRDHSCDDTTSLNFCVISVVLNFMLQVGGSRGSGVSTSPTSLSALTDITAEQNTITQLRYVAVSTLTQQSRTPSHNSGMSNCQLSQSRAKHHHTTQVCSTVNYHRTEHHHTTQV